MGFSGIGFAIPLSLNNKGAIVTKHHAQVEIDGVVTVLKEFDEGKRYCRIDFLGGSFNAMAQADFTIREGMQKILVKVKLDSSKFRASIYNVDSAV